MGYKDYNDHVDIPVYGAIFMSNTGTKKECFQRKLLGLPMSQSNFVLHVREGMILFLFEFEKRQLHGVFRATSDGEIGIEPNAFKSSGKFFPAQVRFEKVWTCYPLSEHEFEDAIRDNYYPGKKFRYGLSKEQVYNLITLFHSRKIPRKPTDGHSRFGENRESIRDRIRFVNEEDEVKEVDGHGYRTLMKERLQKDNMKERFSTNYDDFGKVTLSRNDENFHMDKNKYYRDDENRTQDDYHVMNSFSQSLSSQNIGGQMIDDKGYFGNSPHNLGSQMIDDKGYYGNSPLERDQRRLSGHHEPIDFVTHNALSNINQNNSDFIPIPEIPDQFQNQFQHPFESSYESGYSNSTSYNPSMISLHTPYNPEVPDFIHTPYNPEVPEFCHKPSYFTPDTCSSPVDSRSMSMSDTIPYFSENGKLRSKNYEGKVSVFERLTKAPKKVNREKESQVDEKEDLDESVNKVMKMLEKIVSSPTIKRTPKRKFTYKRDDYEDNKKTSKNVEYDFPKRGSDNVEFEGMESDEELVIEETRVVDFKRRKKIKKNINDDVKESGTESDVGRRRKKLVRPVFVKKNTISDESAQIKVDCNLTKSVENLGNIEGQKSSIEGKENVEKCEVVEEIPQEKDGIDDVARVDCKLTKTVDISENIEGQKSGIEVEENVNVENVEKSEVVEEKVEQKDGFADVVRVGPMKEDEKMCGWIEG